MNMQTKEITWIPETLLGFRFRFAGSAEGKSLKKRTQFADLTGKHF